VIEECLVEQSFVFRLCDVHQMCGSISIDTDVRFVLNLIRPEEFCIDYVLSLR
jgi:predicted metal-dependent hydrolase